MAQQEVIKKITEILNFLFVESDYNKLDQDKVVKTVCEFEDKIRDCFKKDNEIELFFQSKENFRTISDLKTFVKNKLEIKVTSTKRSDIENELSLICLEQNFDIVFLKKNLQQKEKFKKKIKSSKKIENKAVYWFGLSEDELIKDLNSTKKYSSIFVLKEAAKTLLNSKQKKLKTRKSIIFAIIATVKKEKSTMQIGS
ncbi:MAG: hypothetical protein GY760_05035 [Deltaproteobacteria bacterium]|nr:hypothetical protein [Deltaproteobacteria bacterium]